MKVFKALKNVLSEIDLEEVKDYDRELDEIDYTIEGEFLFDHEKTDTLLFYCHLLSVYYDNVPINLDLARDCIEEDEEYFFKLIFYLRDLKGLGRKKEFRIILNVLGEEYSEEFEHYIKYIPIYGRYDDLYELFDTDNEDKVIEIFKNQLEEDLNSENPSTLCKWLKSVNSSNSHTCYLGKRTAKGLKLSYKEYRKTLAALREKLEVVEHLMSAKRWSEIKYGNLTAYNIKKYKNAFLRNDKERFLEFLKISNIALEEEKKTEKSEAFKEMYSYLELLKSGLREDITKKEMITQMKEIYEGLKIEQEDWLPAILLKQEDVKTQNKHYMQSLFLSNFYLCNNAGLYKNYIIQTKGIPNMKKLGNEKVKEDLMDLIKNSISNKISLESVMDLFLLSALKVGIKDYEFPKGVILVVHSEEELKECLKEEGSIGENIEELYLKLNEKWENLNYSIPKLKIWIIEDRFKTEIETIQDGSVYIVKGSGKRAFECIVKDPNMNITNLSYENIRKDLIKLLALDRYKF